MLKTGLDDVLFGSMDKVPFVPFRNVFKATARRGQTQPTNQSVQDYSTVIQGPQKKEPFIESNEPHSFQKEEDRFSNTSQHSAVMLRCNSQNSPLTLAHRNFGCSIPRGKVFICLTAIFSWLWRLKTMRSLVSRLLFAILAVKTEAVLSKYISEKMFFIVLHKFKLFHQWEKCYLQGYKMCLLTNLEITAVSMHQICHLLMISRWFSFFSNKQHESHPDCKSVLALHWNDKLGT